MDINKLIISVGFENEEEIAGWAQGDANERQRLKERKIFFVDYAKLQIAEYVEAFKALPRTDIWFHTPIANGPFTDDYRITYISVDPVSNEVRIYVAFE